MHLNPSCTWLAALLLLSLCATAWAADGAAGRASITVRADRALGGVNPFIFGHNVEAADSQFIFGPYSNTVPGRTGDGFWDPVARRPVPEVLDLARRVRMGMLRYPGGCLVHNFDWKKAVGPVEERPDFAFGVAEFVELCREIGAEPLMNVSAYVGGPQDAADLVEFLNAPATPARPWAMERAASGHTEPFGVVYFEMGNESDHGNHDVKPFRRHTPESYSEWYNDCARRMRAVDPGIRIGALMGTGTGPGDPWNRIVLERAGAAADFIIVHTYAVGLWNPAGDELSDGVLMRACMAAGPQIAQELAEYRAMVLRHTGRDIPLAITEYNASFVGDQPKDRRYWLGPALFSAEYLRELLRPESSVLMANYWHFLNGYWGMVQGPRLPDQQPRSWRLMPAYHLYRLWAQHFGSSLVDVAVESPRIEFEGVLQVKGAFGEDGLPAGVEPGRNLLEGVQLLPAEGRGYRARAAGEGAAVIELDGLTGEAYPLLATVRPIAPATYRLSYTGRSRGGLRGGGLGLGLCDVRGWDATHSANAVEGVQQAEGWTDLSGDLTALGDCPGLTVVWRLRPGDQPATGTVEIRDVRLEAVPGFPAFPALTATASLSEDGETLYLIVFNKHHADAIDAQVSVEGFPVASARVWTVTGPSLSSHNMQDEQVREVEGRTGVAGNARGTFSHTFPAHSMTALELARQG